MGTRRGGGGNGGRKEIRKKGHRGNLVGGREKVGGGKVRNKQIRKE